ncbi:Ig-like domain-containing protein [Ahniella affigens]|nr:Ig-like domain-containing protein [Ahniella affigens]
MPVSGISVQAGATDQDGSIASIEYWLNGVKQTTSANQPTLAWTPTEAGTYSWVIKAKDASNLETVSAPLVISVSSVSGNVAPTVSIQTPLAGRAFEAGTTVVRLIAVATDTAPGSINKVEFFDGATKLPGTVTTTANSGYQLDWALPSEGPHRITARAVDNQGAVTVSSPISVLIAPGLAPTVSLISPTASATYIAPENFELAVSAYDDFGITKVEYFDGTTKIGEVTSAPYSMAWNGVSATGPHNLRAVAWDAAANSASSAIVQVQVNANQVPTITFTSPSGQTVLEGTNVPLGVTVTDPDEPSAVDQMEVVYYRNAAMDAASEIGRSNYFPYRSTWLNVPFGNGTQQVWARVWDRRGGPSAAATATFSVVQNQAPTVSLTTSASSGALLEGDQINLTALAQDSDTGVSKVRFYVRQGSNDTFLSEDAAAPYSAVWTAPVVTAGGEQRQLYAVAFDAADAQLSTTSSLVTLTINKNRPPSQLIIEQPLAPTGGGINGLGTPTMQVVAPGQTLNLRAKVTDPDNNIEYVQFLFENSVVARVDRSSPGQDLFGTEVVVPSNWYSGTMNDRAPLISAKAFDTKGRWIVTNAPVGIDASGYDLCGGSAGPCENLSVPILVVPTGAAGAQAPCGGLSGACTNLRHEVANGTRVEAERYDQGGNGVGHFERDYYVGGVDGLTSARGDAVDVLPTSSCPLVAGQSYVDLVPGCVVSNLDNGERLRYSVTVPVPPQGASGTTFTPKYRMWIPAFAEFDYPIANQQVLNNQSISTSLNVHGVANGVSRTLKFYTSATSTTPIRTWTGTASSDISVNWTPSVTSVPGNATLYVDLHEGSSAALSRSKITVRVVSVLDEAQPPSEVLGVQLPEDVDYSAGFEVYGSGGLLRQPDAVTSGCVPAPRVKESDSPTDRWYLVSGCQFTLPQGEYVMSYSSPSDGLKLDWFRFDTGNGGATTVDASIVSPANQSQFQLGTPITIQADVIGAQAGSTAVNFYQNGTLIGADEDGLAPYTLTWTPPALGSYNLTVQATVGLVTDVSPAVSVTVVPGASNAPPMLAIQKPSGDVTVGAVVELEGTAVDLDGTVAPASVYFDIRNSSGAVLESLAAEPSPIGGSGAYKKNWTANVAPGSYSVRMRALDNLAASGEAIRSFLVVSPGVVIPHEAIAEIPGSVSPQSDGVGATAGQFRVDEGGSATYSIPLLTLPGRAGVGPQMSLNYSSQGGGAGVAKGWSIGGTSAISRCRNAFEHGDDAASMVLDGQELSAGSPGISFTDQDRFCLDGQKLVVVPGTGNYGDNGTEYRTEIDQFARIRSFGGGALGPRYFLVERKDGSVAWYGGSIDTSALPQVLSPGPIARPDAYLQRNQNAGVESPIAPAPFSQPALTWALARTMDSMGNYIDYVYTKDDARAELLISEVRYTGKMYLQGQLPQEAYSGTFAAIQFVYDPLPAAAVSVSYQIGMLSSQTKYLKRIKSVTGATVMREYILNSELSASGSDAMLLKSLTECRGSVCYAPTTFEWAEQKHVMQATQTLDWASSVNGVINTGKSRTNRIGDVDGDGLMDLVWLGKAQVGGTVYDTGICSAEHTAIWVRYGSVVDHGDGSKRFEFKDVPQKPFCVADEIPRDKIEGLMNLIDFNGDGADDLMLGDYIDVGANETTGRWHIYPSIGRRAFYARPDDTQYPPDQDSTDDTAFVRQPYAPSTNDLLPACNDSDPTEAQHCLPISKNGALVQLSDFNGDGLQDVLYGVNNEYGFDQLRIRLQEPVPGSSPRRYRFSREIKVAIDWSRDVATEQYCGFEPGANIPIDGIDGSVPSGDVFITCTLNLRAAEDQRIPGPSVIDLDGDGHADLFATVKHVRTRFDVDSSNTECVDPQRPVSRLPSGSWNTNSLVSYGSLPQGDRDDLPSDNSNEEVEAANLEALAIAYAGNPDTKLWDCAGGDLIEDRHTGFLLAGFEASSDPAFAMVARFKEYDYVPGSQKVTNRGWLQTPSDLAYEQLRLPRMVDMNADGLQDLVFLDYRPTFGGDPVGKVLTLLNLGTRFQTLAEGTVSHDISTQKFIEFADISGDGLPDFLFPRALDQSGGEENNRFVYRITRNDGRPGVPDCALGNFCDTTGNYDTLIHGNDPKNWTRFFGDFDGDGALDYVGIQMAHSNGGGAGGPGAQQNNFKTSRGAARSSASPMRYRNRDALLSFTNGLGAKTEINYEPLTNGAVYQRSKDARGFNAGRGSAMHDLLASIYVVAKVQSDAPTDADPNGKAKVYYQYRNARMQGGGRGYLGFGEIRTFDTNFPDQHVVTITQYSQTFPFVGMPRETRKYLVGTAYVESQCLGAEGPEIVPTNCFSPGDPIAGLHFNETGFDKLISYAWSEFDLTATTPGSVYPFVKASFEATGNPDSNNSHETIGTTVTYLRPDVSNPEPAYRSNQITADQYLLKGQNYASLTALRAAAQTAVVSDSGLCSTGKCVTRVFTDSSFGDNVDDWRLGRMLTTKVDHYRYDANGNPPIQPTTRRTAFTYDLLSPAKTGLLVTQTLQPDRTDSQFLKTIHFRDQYGNITKTMTCSYVAAVETDCDEESDISAILQRPVGVSDSPLDYVHRYVEAKFSADGRFADGSYVPYFSGSEGSTTQVDRRLSGEVLVRDELGNVLQARDVHGITATTTFGPFGRAQTTQGPDGSASANEFHWCNGKAPANTGQVADCPSNAVFRQTSYVRGGARSVAFFDKLGRKFLSVSEGANADLSGDSRWTAVCNSYDTRGRAESVSDPFFVDTATTGLLPRLVSVPDCSSRIGSRTTYDYLDRILTIRMSEDFTDQGPANTVKTYNGLTTITTVNFKRNGILKALSQTEIKDASGLIARSIDQDGKEARYRYDNTGNLIEVRRNAASNTPEIVSSITYDDLGRKTGQSDPDAGLASYVYNAAGEMICGRDARGFVTVTDYDILGRAWRERNERGTCAVTTDRRTIPVGEALAAPTTGESRIVEMTWFDYGVSGGHSGLGMAFKTARYQTIGANYGQTDLMTKTVSWDHLRRPTGSTTSFAYAVDNDPTVESYTDAITYDSIGRPATNTDASGGVTENMYSSHGFLRRVRSATQPSLVYFEALAANERGQVTKERKHGNVAITTRRDYNPYTGRIEGIQTGTDNGNALLDNPVQDLSVGWDVLGNLTNRQDLRQGLVEAFTYDNLNRLLLGRVHQNGALRGDSISLGYDALGNICSKATPAGAQTYQYGNGSACGTPDTSNPRPHAVTQMQGPTGTFTYQYDEAGNQTRADHSNNAKDRDIRFGAEGLADRIVVGNGNSSSDFRYGPGGRYLRTDVKDGITTITRYVSGIELITKRQGGVETSRERKRYIGGFLILTQKIQSGGTVTEDYRYLLGDHLGSTDTLVDEQGVVKERLSFDPHGNRRAAEGAGVWITAVSNYQAANTTHGFTGHEHIDHAEIVHMNGRLYDPILGRMLSPDPIVQELYNLQNLNRYTYVLNNPLSLTDPTGLSWMDSNWRSVAAAVIVVAAIAIPILAKEAAAAVKFAVAVSAGAASGGIGSASTKGALIGAFSAAVFFGIGQHFQGVANGNQLSNGAVDSLVESSLGNYIDFSGYYAKTLEGGLTAGQMAAKVLAHGIAGGVTQTLGGGKFGAGFLAAGITQLLAPGIDKIGGDNFVGKAQRVIVSGLIGGTMSVVTGGKFASGALTAMFSRAFNDEMSHMPCESSFDCEQMRAIDQYLSGDISEKQMNDVFFWQGAGGVLGAATAGVITRYGVPLVKLGQRAAQAQALQWVLIPNTLRYQDQNYVRLVLFIAGFSPEKYTGETVGAWRMVWKNPPSKPSILRRLKGTAVQWSPEGNRMHLFPYYKVTGGPLGTTRVPYLLDISNVPSSR